MCWSHQLAYLTVGFWPGPWAKAPYLETDRISSRPVPAWHVVEEVSGANWQADGQTGYRALPASPRGGSEHARQLHPGAVLHEEANMGRLCIFLSLVSQYANTTIVRWGSVDHYFVSSDIDFVYMPMRVMKYGWIMWQNTHTHTHTHIRTSPHRPLWEDFSHTLLMCSLSIDWLQFPAPYLRSSLPLYYFNPPLSLSLSVSLTLLQPTRVSCKLCPVPWKRVDFLGEIWLSTTVNKMH